MDSTGAGTWKCSSAMQRVSDLYESLMGARDAAWEERYTGVVEFLIDVGVFTLPPMDTGYGYPQKYSRLSLV